MYKLAMLLSVPINLLIIYCIYKEFQDHQEEKRRKQNKLDNLVNERIYVNISLEEKDMLEMLCKRTNQKPSQFIHSVLKDDIKQTYY